MEEGERNAATNVREGREQAILDRAGTVVLFQSLEIKTEDGDNSNIIFSAV